MEQKKTKKKNIPLIVLIVVIVLGLLGFGGYKGYQWYIWRTPDYYSKSDKVLLSDKVHKLTNQQKQAFTDIAWGAIETKDKDIKRQESNYEDYSLYVEKDKAPKTYDIVYVCKADDGTKLETDMTLKIDEPTLKGDTHFTIKKYSSDFDAIEQLKNGLVKSVADLANTLTGNDN